MGVLAATTRAGALIGGWDGEAKEFSQRCRARLMHGRAHHHFDGLQIEVASLAMPVEDDAQQLAYFARDFLADRFSRFFSWADGVGCSTGRNTQICSLTSNS